MKIYTTTAATTLVILLLAAAAEAFVVPATTRSRTASSLLQKQTQLEEQHNNKKNGGENATKSTASFYPSNRPSSSSSSSSYSRRSLFLQMQMQIQPDGFGEWMLPGNNGKDYNDNANPYMYHPRPYQYHITNDGGYNWGQTQEMAQRAADTHRFNHSPIGNRRVLPPYAREEFSHPSFHIAQNEELMWKYCAERNFIENPRGTNLRGYYRSGW